MARYNRLGLLVIVALFGLLAFGQIDTPTVPPEKDLGDLFLRASASRMVVVGTVVKSEGVSRRLSAAEAKGRVQKEPGKETAVLSLDNLVGGSLLEVRIEETICRQTDFEVSPAQANHVTAQPNQSTTLFFPRDEPLWKDGYQKEFLFEGRKYLLFLVVPDRATQQDWVNSFQLDPQRTYYRGEERSRGVVALNMPSPGNPVPQQPLVLDKVRQLCQAVRPSTLEGKLAALGTLATSGDPVLQKEAALAVEALKSRKLPRK